ncbi:pectate lyase [Brevundimonas sp. PAMC22021]|nr:pectate lyase [Brevundimonas sp. PAMC22021]
MMKMQSVMLALIAAGAILSASVGASAQTPAWGSSVLRQKAGWYASPQALAMARTVMLHQSPEGGWPKNSDLARPPSASAEHSEPTFDNNGTTQPMAFLARVASASDDAAVEASFLRGLDYVLAAQQPHGGWPQFYPLRGGYYDHITFNDDAMVHILTLLSDVARGADPYAFVDAERRDQAGRAVQAGIDVILKTQIRKDGVLTAWCAQHDERTFEPAWARRFEPPSLSGNESVGIVRFLMSRPDPSPEMIAAVDGAVAWFQASAIPDLRLETIELADGREDRQLIAAPGERLWARFYDLQTNRPVYMGRDSVPHERLEDIEFERRNGYHYVGTWPEALLTRDYPRWKAGLAR